MANKTKTYEEVAREMVEEAMQEDAEKERRRRLPMVEVCSCKSRKKVTKYANNLRNLKGGEFYG